MGSRGRRQEFQVAKTMILLNFALNGRLDDEVTFPEIERAEVGIGSAVF